MTCSERGETDSFIEPGRCVYVRGEIGWLTNSRFIAEGSSKVAHTGKRWSVHSIGDSGTELVPAVLKGLKQQLQYDGSLGINAFDLGMTRPANVGRRSRLIYL